MNGLLNLKLDRRGFFRRLPSIGWAAGLWALVATLAVWLFGGVRFLRWGAMSRPAARLVIGRPEDYPLGSVDARYRDSHGLWIVHESSGGAAQIVALSAVCTHLGCLTAWQSSERKFRCPCHGSVFLVSGECVAGPAPRPLERYAIRLLDDGRIEVDTGRSFRQERGQWSDPESRITL